MSRMKAPDHTEAADYYFTYINQVDPGDIRDILEAQGREALSMLAEIPESRADYRYAPEKWTIRQVVNHVNDAERVFSYRALWFARGFEAPLPSYDQNIAIASANVDMRSLRDHVEEFRAIRSATVPLFRHLPDDAWDRRGVASSHPVTVRALAYIIAGHVAHHLKILRERYL